MSAAQCISTFRPSARYAESNERIIRCDLRSVHASRWHAHRGFEWDDEHAEPDLEPQGSVVMSGDLCTPGNDGSSATHLSPDCRDGKHLACTGWNAAWCYIEDNVTQCDCGCHAPEPREMRTA